MTPLRVVRRIASTPVFGGPFSGGNIHEKHSLSGCGGSGHDVAGFCQSPKDVKIIDEALAKATGLTEMQMTEIKALRDKGDALHKSGNHGESIKVLHEATKILGVEPYKAM